MSMTTTTYEIQNSDGTWTAPKSTGMYSLDEIVVAIIRRDGWLAAREAREIMSTADDVHAYLATGKSLQFGDDWSDKIRQTPEPRVAIVTPVVVCDCGHSVNPINVMSASLGTSCVDCYDRMSA